MWFLFSTEWSKQKEITINFAEITLSELDYASVSFMPKLVTKMEEIIAEQHYLPLEMASRDTLIRLQTTVAFPLPDKMLDAKQDARCQN